LNKLKEQFEGSASSAVKYRRRNRGSPSQSPSGSPTSARAVGDTRQTAPESCLFIKLTTRPRIRDGYIRLSPRGHAQARATHLEVALCRKNVTASARPYPPVPCGGPANGPLCAWTSADRRCMRPTGLSPRTVPGVAVALVLGLNRSLRQRGVPPSNRGSRASAGLRRTARNLAA
jgi:hypothetical protein